uniref:Zgc:109986 n=1 Tax=Oryzias sinensis TaxID=183150 RepID=A0A8C7Z475_9TELE
MNFEAGRSEVLQLLSRLSPSELPKLLDWIKNSDDLDHLLDDNNKVILQNIADDLRARLPLDAMLPSETTAHLKMQQCARPTVHVDSFLYSDEQVDSLCEEGAMSRTYCLRCGSTQTAPLDFISHSFSAAELQFLFQNVLPDLSGRTLVDVGSRLGAVLYGGYVYSSASKLVGLELSGDFVRMQNDMLQKYQMTDRVQVLHADVCTQDVLLQNADVLIMNNVFEYFMEPSEQVRAWTFIMQNFRRTGCLLVTVPSLQESLNHLQVKPIQLQPGWLEELPVDHNVYLGKEADPESLALIHLYRVM